jgi:hypothetical protein
MSGGHFPISQLLIIGGRKMSTRQCVICGTEKKTKCGIHCRKCADKIAGTKKIVYRTKKRYSNCVICGAEKKTKEAQYAEHCEKCGKTAVRHPKAFNEYEIGLRTCRICNETKSLSLFVTHGKTWKRACKKCDNERRKQILYERRKTDPAYRLKEGMAQAIRTTLKRDKDNKPTFALLPYTKEQLKEHIQNQFDANMSWDNYGSYWHLDHIIPQDALQYDSFDHPNFLKCWSLDNLRPLEAKKNIRKSNKTPTL